MKRAERLAGPRTRKALCRHASISRQAVYKEEKKRAFRKVEEETIVSSIKDARKTMPKLSVRKIHEVTRAPLAAKGIAIGRDELFSVARKNGLLLKRRRRAVKTTESGHRLRVYPNLLKENPVAAPHEAFVKDITYVALRGGRFLFLALVTDLYSRKIVGWNLGSTLEAVGCMKALWMAIAQLPANASPIAHSDRGKQYACGEYVELAKGRGLRISMTEENHCYENAVAERVNGILKGEFGIGDGFADEKAAYAAVKEAITIYNTWRPHRSLQMKTPEEVHGGEPPIWRTSQNGYPQPTAGSWDTCLN